MIALHIFQAVASIAALIAVLHYCFTAAFRPERHVQLLRVQRIPPKLWAYGAFVVIGFAVMLFTGFDALLAWMPLSWAQIGEDGIPLRKAFAGLLATLGLSIMPLLDNTARYQLQVAELRQEVARLQGRNVPS